MVNIENRTSIWYTGSFEEEMDGRRPRGDLGQRALLSEVEENSYFKTELEGGLFRQEARSQWRSIRRQRAVGDIEVEAAHLY